MFSLNDKIHRRAGHVSFIYDNGFYIWGGLVEHLSKRPSMPNTIPKNSNDLHDTGELFRFDLDAKTWGRVVTSGDIPPRSFSAARSVFICIKS